MAEDSDKKLPAEEAMEEPFDRRGFLRSAALGGGVLGLGGLAGYAVNKVRGGGAPRREVTPPIGADYTYDVSKFQTTDPALRKCEEVLRFPAGVRKASALAVGADGMIAVGGEEGIHVFNAKGASLHMHAMDTPVLSVAVRPSGEILAGQAGRIVVLDAAGAERAVWDGFPDEFLPTSIEVAGDEVFVADAGNRVVHRLDATGKTLAVIGEKDPERNVPGFKVPSPYFCVRLADDGLLRVANPGVHRIEAYTVDGDFELGWGKTSFGVEGFCGCCNPVSFALFPDGSFVTGEKGLPRVKLYDPQGKFTGMVAGPEDFPEYLDVVNAGARSATGAGIYVAIAPEDRIVVLDGIGREVRVMKMKEVSDG